MTAAVLLLAAVLLWRVTSAPGPLAGTVVPEPYPAPDFTLTDQFGRTQSLAALRGRPVAIAFLYTNCPDICPLVAGNVHAAYQQLGPGAQRVAILAVTVDPERDTVEQVRRYSEERGLAQEWLFLTGSRPQLEAVWSAYGIYARPVDAQGHPVTPSAEANPAANAELIEHSAPVYLIDRRGYVRALLPNDFTAGDLVTSLRSLLAER